MKALLFLLVLIFSLNASAALTGCELPGVRGILKLKDVPIVMKDRLEKADASYCNPLDTNKANLINMMFATCMKAISFVDKRIPAGPLKGKCVDANHRAVDNYNYIYPKNEISYKNLKAQRLTETQTLQAELESERAKNAGLMEQLKNNGYAVNSSSRSIPKENIENNDVVTKHAKGIQK